MSILRPLLGLLARVSPVSRYVVDGPSMEPAYRPGTRLIVNRIAYLRRLPAPGDVIVLRDPEDGERLLLKRVAAPPNGDQPASKALWVLGDNAHESRDSRAFGFVERRRIIGKAWLRY